MSREKNPQIIPTLPLSMQDLQNFYTTALAECEFLLNILNSSLALLDARMKPSAYVSVQFNRYESYFCSMLEHLKWKVSWICVDPGLPISKSPVLKKIISLEYKHSGIGHPIDHEEIDPLKNCLDEVIKNLELLIDEIERKKLKSIFLCHSSKDKAFSRKLATDLIFLGAKVWLDEAEINIGDSLIQKIEDGIKDFKYFGIILSKNSVESNWVKNELEIALNTQIKSDQVKVLPLLIENCNIPAFLTPKFFADFRNLKDYSKQIDKLVKRLKM